MSDRDRARSILTRLRDSGIQISVDDYGTGYSSLSYLLDLPIDELKLDRSFVFPMADDARAAALVASTIALAHSLDLRIVAEGVETGVVFTELRRLGCDQAQGYFMSAPVSAVELDYWLNNRAELDPSLDVTGSKACSRLVLVTGTHHAVAGRIVSLYEDQVQ
jgi:EAL domain-containing protein (putative c-di-GMP-specific phosphodiesterase class I)